MIKLLSNNKILDITKLKASADDKINATQMFGFFVFDMVENTVGKVDNCFLFFPNCFRKSASNRSSKSGIVW